MNKKKKIIGVVGATGAVGRTLIDILEERNFPVDELRCFSSHKGAGTKIKFNKKVVTVKELKKNKSNPFESCDIVFFTSSSSVSKEYVPSAVSAGAYVIDNSSYYRLQKDIPLIIPEINRNRISKQTKIIANPNCTTAQMVMALKPISDAFGLERVFLSSYQAVSGRGKKGVDEIKSQIVKTVKSKFKNAQSHSFKAKEFPHTIAFNCIPQVDVFMADGFTGEEHKVMAETRKILELPNLKIAAHCVRVPVLNGHSEMVNIETKKDCNVDQIRAVLSKFSGVSLMDDFENMIYPLATVASGKDNVFVGRIRKDPSLTERDNGFILWVVADNLRKGAALNAVQIAECLNWDS